MKSLKLGFLVLAGASVVGSAGCGSREPTAKEKADAARRYEAMEQRRLAEQIAAFPASAPQMITNLESITTRDVSDMEAAASTIRVFDQAAMDIRIVEDAAREGAIPVSSQAVAAKDQLKRILIQKQRELFPVMRRTYAAYVSDAVSGAGANFRAVGTGGKILRAASPSFTSREVVMEAHYTLAGQANRFRFSQAEYVYSLTGASDVIEMRGRADHDIR
ncbi:hypothetical protein [Brevundimonas sp.]|uniref:hypothetical protein n=1 Tax=Brevundimonas sp. TaxID=1871086 RepID=UPI002D30F585|nr:hypothetical protein [Brevundimonas sp.]HYC98532.1 hypothetical protein [Brevundimonas sp.]